jgi:hypothetical protein
MRRRNLPVTPSLLSNLRPPNSASFSSNCRPVVSRALRPRVRETRRPHLLAAFLVGQECLQQRGEFGGTSFVADEPRFAIKHHLGHAGEFG